MKVAARKPIGPRPLIPGWCIMLAIPVTAVVTIWALRGNFGPSQGASHEVPMQVQPHSAAPAPVPQVIAPQVIAPQVIAPQVTGDGLQKVAVVQRLAPVIVAGSQRRHLDRGNCTLCHTIVRPNGTRMPTIRSDSIMPHPYPGGQCINCHTTVPPLPGFTGVALPGVMQPMQNTMKTPEAKWKGMEVAPISALTAMQFGTPAGINGAVVTEVEGKAAAAGVRAGDVVMGVNGAPVTDVMSFNAATQNGALPAGSVQVLRGGTLIEVPIDSVWVGAAAVPGASIAMPPPPGWDVAQGQLPVAAPAVQGAGCAPGAVMNLGAAPAPAVMALGQNGAAPF